MASNQDISQLNSFLRGERSAVATYDQVMAKAAKEEEKLVTDSLRPGRDSHAKRVELLEERVRSLGGDPSDDGGVWEAFATSVQAGAKLFGLSSAVSVLEEGEDHGLEDYRKDMDDISAESQRFVHASLLPEQQKTHDLVARIKAQV